MQLHTKIIKHESLSSDNLLAICEIKSLAWSFSLESQKLWITQNIEPDDLHFLLYNNHELIAYMNLVRVEALIDGNYFSVFGIGNVCSKRKGVGYGGLLMNKVGDFLIEKNKIGLLFCKNYLLPFYIKYNWTLIGKEKRYIPFETAQDFNVLSLNLNLNFNTLQYKDRLF